MSCLSSVTPERRPIPHLHYSPACIALRVMSGFWTPAVLLGHSAGSTPPRRELKRSLRRMQVDNTSQFQVPSLSILGFSLSYYVREHGDKSSEGTLPQAPLLKSCQKDAPTTNPCSESLSGNLANAGVCCVSCHLLCNFRQVRKNKHIAQLVFD